MRRTTPLAWALAALAVLLYLAGAALSLTTGTGSLLLVLTGCIAGVFSAVGAMIASRQPRNAIGWIFLGIAVMNGLSALTRGYAERWLAGGAEPSALAETAAWFHSSSWIFSVVPCATFLLLLFPDGRLLSRRWRGVAWASGAGIALSFAGSSTRPGPLEDFPSIRNPYPLDRALQEPLEMAGALAVLLGTVGSVAALINRMRRARQEERQQIKWLAWAGSVTATITLAGAAGYELVGPTVANTAILASLTSLPVAAGVAILKYRLYDIDVVINRTLVYGALTAALAATYLGSVLLLQLVLDPLTQDSGLAVAGSTLAVAALFRPALARIQQLVDRRFFRRRYDTAQTLEGFSLRVRDEVDLDALGAELQAVVREAMQPGHVSLWLRQETAR